VANAGTTEESSQCRRCAREAAHAIHDWPIAVGTIARVITITASVTAITIARLILDPLGL
jgi:hypothetical protein